MNVALAGFYIRMQRPGRPDWGRPVGTRSSARCSTSRLYSIDLQVDEFSSVVMGHEWMAGAGRPAWGRAACPQHVECSSLCPFASCLIKVPTPCCLLPEKRKVGPTGLHGAARPAPSTLSAHPFVSCFVLNQSSHSLLLPAKEEKGGAGRPRWGRPA